MILSSVGTYLDAGTFLRPFTLKRVSLAVEPISIVGTLALCHSHYGGERAMEVRSDQLHGMGSDFRRFNDILRSNDVFAHGLQRVHESLKPSG